MSPLKAARSLRAKLAKIMFSETSTMKKNLTVCAGQSIESGCDSTFKREHLISFFAKYFHICYIIPALTK
jgi:hypothetical protein